LRAAAADPARGSLLTVLRAVGLNGQRVYAADVRSRTYLRDLDVQIATSAVQVDPVTGKIEEGAVLDIRPRLAPDASHALIETRFHMSRLTALETFEPGGAAQGRLQLPVRDNLVAGTTVGCPIGRTLLLCAGTAGADGQVTAVLLRPSLSADGAGGAVKSTEKREMRFFDVANLTQQVPDFSSGFRLLSQKFQSGDGPGLTFSSPELVGSTVEPEDLENWIRSNVEPRSWKNSRNRIEMWGTHFAVVQTPEVLDQIAAFLAAAVPNRSRMVSVESALVAFDEAGWLARRASLSGANPAEADVAAVLDAARRGDGCRIVGGTQVAAMNGERVHCWNGMDRDFVLDVDSEVTESASASDPVVGGIDGGFSLEVRPTMAGDQRTIRLELRPVWQDVSPPEMLDPQADGIAPFQRLRTAEFRFDGLQFVGENTWTLAGTASRNSDGRREVMVLLVRARSMEVK
ncbi:MAG: hypothetical protein HUU15_11105, partial [Candidatus Brocadiae bacterium]|nr:hypothetical protein [Candidatus Brocadiia bacterium]